jgi:hypothetical protein
MCGVGKFCQDLFELIARIVKQFKSHILTLRLGSPFAGGRNRRMAGQPTSRELVSRKIIERRHQEHSR